MKKYSLALLIAVTPVAANSQFASSGNSEMVAEPVSNSKVLTGRTTQDRIYHYRKFLFLDHIVFSYLDTSRSILSFQFIQDARNLRLGLSKEELESYAGETATFGDQAVIPSNLDIPHTVSLGEALSRLADLMKPDDRKVNYHNLPVPTDTEIDILKLLWKRPAISSSDIYAAVDNLNLTSEDLQDILEAMSEKGFVDREKISPSHEFSFFDLASVELSAKNRKNKLFIYWPMVSKNRLVAYLDAKRFLSLGTGGTDGGGQDKRLEQTLYRLLR